MTLSPRLTRPFRAAACLLSAGCVTAHETRTVIAGTTCEAPPRIDCPEANCDIYQKAALGDAVEPFSGRTFFLDFPCDLRKGERVNFILNLHGAGAVGSWQRHYFPAFDLKGALSARRSDAQRLGHRPVPPLDYRRGRGVYPPPR